MFFQEYYNLISIYNNHRSLFGILTVIVAMPQWYSMSVLSEYIRVSMPSHWVLVGPEGD